MFYLPLFHRLHGSRVLVVGAGQTALRKLRWLRRAGARITVMAPEVHPDIRRMRDAGELSIDQRTFDPEVISSEFTLAISATDAPQVSERVFAAALKHKILVNCVDRTELCTVIFPSIIDRMPILVAVSSMGASPTLARTVRGWIEIRLPSALGKLAVLAERLRSQVKQQLPSVDSRKAFWDRVFASSAADLAMGGQVDAAVERATSMLNEQSVAGTLVLVGAGPGDPDLITLRGLREIQSADVLLFDKLVNPALLDYARRDAELIDVGKPGPREAMDGETTAPQRRPSGTAMQAEVNRLIVAHAGMGKKVIRLKGGDPFIFGRGGEELQVAAEAGIETQVVPGITSGLGAACYAGIPLTHRKMSQSVRFLTGHRVEQSINLDWPELARTDQTLVVYMGLVALASICQRLLEAGRGQKTPVAVVENATFEHQRIIWGYLDDIPVRVANADVRGPSIIIVGEVVSLAEGWSGELPRE